MNLTEKAGIHRKTFYLHYTCIEALYEDMLEEILSQYLTEVRKLSVPYDYFDLTKILYDFFEHNEFAAKLFCDEKYQDFSNKLMLQAIEENKSYYNPFEKFRPEEQDVIYTFLAGSSMDIYRTWVSQGRKIPVDELSNLTGTLLEKGLSGLNKSAKK